MKTLLTIFVALTLAQNAQAVPTISPGGPTNPMPVKLVGGALPNQVQILDSLGANITVGQKVMASSLPVAFASDQGALSCSQSGTWNERLFDSSGNGLSSTLNTGKQSLDVNITGGSANPSVGLNGAAIPTSSGLMGYKDGSGNLQPVAGSGNGIKVDGSSVTQPVSAASLPLPTGAATSANQTTANTSLASIDGKLNSLGQKTMANSMPVVIASDQSAVPASQSGTWNLNNITGTVSLPTGAATSANQTTANTSLASIDTKLTSPLAVNVSRKAPRIDSSNNNISNVALAPLAVDSGTSEDAQYYQSLDLNVQSNQDLFVDIYQSDDGTNWYWDDTYTVSAGQNMHWTVKLTARYFHVEVTNIGVANANYRVKTYLNPDSDQFPHMAVDTSTRPLGYYRIRTKSESSQLPASLGQQTMAGSTSVTIASNQSSVPVTAAQGTAAALSGAWPVKLTDGTNTMPTMDAVGRAGFHKITDGTNTAAVKAASTAAAATDPALVVAVSPNNSVQTKAPLNNTPSLSSGTATTTPATVTAPANTVEEKIQAIDTNTANLRVVFGGTCSSSNGVQLQPGRSEDFKINANVSICSESGSQGYVIQWSAQ